MANSFIHKYGIKLVIFLAFCMCLTTAAIGVSQPANAVPACSSTGSGMLSIPNAPTCPSNMQGANVWSGIVMPYALWALGVVTFAVGFLAVMFVIWGGFQYMTSAGDPARAQNGQKTLVHALTGLGIALVAKAGIVFVSSAFSGTGGVISSDGTSGSLPTAIVTNMSSILTLVYFVAGALAVIMIIYAAIQWITSAGDPAKATKARQTLTYSVVGFVIIILAYAITQFVSDKIGTGSATTVIGNVTSAMFYVVGILAVVMIIFSGIRYASSTGNPKAVDSAKTTLMYSVVGLVVAILAYAIVSFVIARLQ